MNEDKGYNGHIVTLTCNQITEIGSEEKLKKLERKTRWLEKKKYLESAEKARQEILDLTFGKMVLKYEVLVP